MIDKQRSKAIKRLDVRAPVAIERMPHALADFDYDESSTMLAWENFLDSGMSLPCKAMAIRPLIHDSWGRSVSQGIKSNLCHAPISEDAAEVEDLRQSNTDLLNAARRSFSSIGRLLEGTGAMMVLADRDGALLDAIGDTATLNSGRDIHLAVGGKWNEKVVGTNGIGTALATGQPVFVHAAEHFCFGIKSWTCAGAPIRDQVDGEIIGVVDLSGDKSIFRPHNTVVVAAAAREIENVLAEQQQEKRARLLEAFIATAPVYMRSDAVVILDRRGRAIYSNNLPKDSFADAPDLDAKLRPGGRLLNVPIARTEAEMVKALPSQLLNVCDVSPLRLGGEFRGAALVFSSRRTQARSTPRAAEGPPQRDAASLIVGESPAIRAAIDAAIRVSRSDKSVPLLIEGETGVGKELFVRLVHSGGAAPNAPFVAMNCGAITRDLFGSELFGHVAGAFTGATREGKPGVFELANGGTLCLDEIGEMPLEMQPFLLRVLEDWVVKRLGDNRPRSVSLRLIASTNRDMMQEVAAGRFRRDLFHRIGAVTIKIPPLRERAEDVVLLLNHFNRSAAEHSDRELKFSDDALNALLAYSWPGNVRELKNLVGRLHVLARGLIVDLSDLPDYVIAREPAKAAPASAGGASHSPGIVVGELQALRDALAAEAGNLSRVALRLGISRPTLYRRLAQYGIRRHID